MWSSVRRTGTTRPRASESPPWVDGNECVRSLKDCDNSQHDPERNRARMQAPSSALFDIGLAAGGCLLTFPTVKWFWPLEEEPSWTATMMVAFAVSYAFVRLTNRLAIDFENDLARLRGKLSDTRQGRETRSRG